MDVPSLARTESSALLGIQTSHARNVTKYMLTSLSSDFKDLRDIVDKFGYIGFYSSQCLKTYLDFEQEIDAWKKQIL